MGVARTPFTDISWTSFRGATGPVGPWDRTNKGFGAGVAHKHKAVLLLRGIERRIEAPGEGICETK